MRKITTLILISTLIMMSTGCGKKNVEKDIPPSENAKTNAEESTTGDENKDEVQEQEKWNIESGSSFYDGVAVIRTTDEKSYAIDKEGNKLFDVTTDDKTIIFFDDIASADNSLINKKGEIVASPEKNGYTGLLTEYVDGYAVAYYYEDEYPSPIAKIGVLDSNGEWSVPLSETHKLLTEAESLGENPLDSLKNVKIGWASGDSENLLFSIDYYAPGTPTYYGNSVFKIFDFFYEASTDTIIHEMQDDIIDEDVYINITKHRKYTFEGSNVTGDGYTFKILTNDVGAEYYTVLDESGGQMFEPVKMEGEAKCICIDKEGFVYKGSDGFTYYDLEGNPICQYKDVKNMQPFYDDLSCVEGENGMIRYIDKAGETIIE